jgi:hypothetical protein
MHNLPPSFVCVPSVRDGVNNVRTGRFGSTTINAGGVVVV